MKGKSQNRGTGGAASRRRETVRLKTAKGRKVSSTMWLDRQLNDPYVAAAKAEGYRSRAAYKLLQMDEKYRLLKPGQYIVDLGAAPGGWSQVAAERIFEDKGAVAVARSAEQSRQKKGRIVALDILPMGALPNVEVLHADFTADDAPSKLRAALGGKAHLVLSDMAAPTTGHKATDHIRIIALAEMALEFAREVLVPGGAFVCKLFQGGGEGDFMKALKTHFAQVHFVKPAASRSGSAETYVVAKGFKS